MPVCVAAKVLKVEDSTQIGDALDELERRQMAWCVRDARGHITLAGATWLGRCVARLHGLDDSTPPSGLDIALAVTDPHPSIHMTHTETNSLTATSR